MKKRLLTLLLALASRCRWRCRPPPHRRRWRCRARWSWRRRWPSRCRRAADSAPAPPLAEPTRVVAFAPALADGYGADRVLHLAAWQEYVLEFSDAAAARRALARRAPIPDVTDCFLDEAVTADDTLAGLWDETASRSWGGHEMGLTTLRHQADVLLPAGRRATVAVIDTGAEVSHPLLAGRVSARSYDFADNTADVTDVNGHGTATAGLIADLTPDEVDVMVLRVYGDDNLSKPSRVLTALEYALENGATVVNMSIGWPNAIEKGYSFLNSVLAQAYAAGVVVVAAAGNLSRSNPTANADDVYPANQAQVLTVSAVDRSRTFDDTYSASGASVDLYAPGTGVAVAALSGGMTVRSGTSFAAPPCRGGGGLRAARAAGRYGRARAPDALRLCRGSRRARPRRSVRQRVSGAHAVLSRPAVSGAALCGHAGRGRLVARRAGLPSRRD
ncbi:MAG: S8 family peptidase [Oscillospiraceae bacterium]